MANPTARYRHQYSNGLTRYLIIVGAILQCSGAWAQNTLAAAIWNQYRVSPTIPFVAFEQDSPTAPFPGSTITDISARTLDGISTYDLSTATVCTVQNYDYPKLRGTQGFRQTFTAGGAPSRTELRLLFAFDDDTLATIRSYQATISQAQFLTIPYDRVLAVQAQTRGLPGCSGPKPSAFKTVIKPIVANIEIVFQLTRPLSAEAVRALRRTLAPDLQETKSLEVRFSINHKLIALGITE